MSKNRYINTKFWDDSYITNLDPIEKLVFLYFLTNPLTKVSGIYEIQLKRAAFDTGVEKDTVLKILERFTKEEKMFYFEGWVILKNFIKNQSINTNMEKGIQRELAELPQNIKEFVLNNETLRKAFEPFGILNLNINLNSNLNSNLNPNGKLMQPEAAGINKVFNILYKINPTLNYGNKTQRSAVERLLKKLGEEKALKSAEAAVAIYGKQYAPTITTPLQLENKISELVAFYKKNQNQNLVITDPNL